MIYTDGTYVLATSDRELQHFMNEIHLQDLPYNAASFLPYYYISPKHLEIIVAAGAFMVSPDQLQEKAQELYNTAPYRR